LILRTVTITGADDEVRPKSLRDLSGRFPFGVANVRVEITFIEDGQELEVVQSGS